jgi:hypothetical protein
MKKAIILEYKRLDKPRLPKPEKKLSYNFESFIHLLLIGGAIVLQTYYGKTGTGSRKST